MGAALTYARRYALFTLVGIAGEDDLDAPDLGPIQGTQANGKLGSDAPGQSNGRAAGSAGGGNGSGRKPLPRQSAPILAPAESSAARERLITELIGFTTPDQLTDWAFRQLPVKNTLVAEDAERVEAAFREKLGSLGGFDAAPPIASSPESSLPQLSEEMVGQSRRAARARIDKSVLAISEPRRHRDKEHLKFVATHTCLICGREPSDPHHLRFTQARALGRKVSDEFTVPLCRSHHREVHRSSNECAWWAKYNVDPLPLAAGLWAQTHPLAPRAEALEHDARTAAAHQGA
jgi:hypothetical protein